MFVIYILTFVYYRAFGVDVKFIFYLFFLGFAYMTESSSWML